MVNGVYLNTVAGLVYIARSWGGWFGWCGRVNTGKAEVPSGQLAFATRHVDLMVAGMRATLALCQCADGWPFSPTKRRKLDQMVVRVQGAPDAHVTPAGWRHVGVQLMGRICVDSLCQFFGIIVAVMIHIITRRNFWVHSRKYRNVTQVQFPSLLEK